MASRKTKVSDDQLPHCEHCKCGEFKPGESIGECHLLPMDWVVIDAGPIPMWKPAQRNGYCKHFDRKVH